MNKSKKTMILCSSIAFLIAILVGGIVFFSRNKDSQINSMEEVASTIRLMKMEGDVSIQNTSGATISGQSRMKLYNGYQITTSSESYAWVTFDDHKLVKIDANSIVEVQKKKEKVALYLVSGNLFFNVDEPLKAAEGFHVKTSTMTMGIRGTSGIVTAVADGKSEVRLLTGKVHVYVEEAVNAKNTTYILNPGNLLQCNALQDEKKAETVVITMSEKDIPEFAAVEIATNEQLQERIEEETKLNTASIIEHVEQTVVQTEEKQSGESIEVVEQNDTLAGNKSLTNGTSNLPNTSTTDSSSNQSTEAINSTTNSSITSSSSGSSQSTLEEGSIGESTVENSTEGTTSAPVQKPTTEGTTSAPVEDPTTEGTTSAPVEDPTTEGTTSTPIEDPTTEGTTSAPVEDPTTEGTTSTPIEEDPGDDDSSHFPPWWDDFWKEWEDFWKDFWGDLWEQVIQGGLPKPLPSQMDQTKK